MKNCRRTYRKTTFPAKQVACFLIFLLRHASVHTALPERSGKSLDSIYLNQAFQENPHEVDVDIVIRSNASGKNFHPDLQN